MVNSVSLGDQQQQKRTSGVIYPVLGTAIGAGAGYFIPKAPSQDEFVKTLKDGGEIKDLTPEEQKLVAAAKKEAGKAPEASSSSAKSTSSATPDEKAVKEEVKKLFPKKEGGEVTGNRLLSGKKPKDFATSVVKPAEKALEKQQGIVDEAIEKHDKLVTDLETAKSATTKDAIKELRDSEVTPDDAKAAEKAKDKAITKYNKAVDDLNAAQTAADDAAKASKAKPNDKKLKATADKKAKALKAKQKAYEEIKAQTELIEKETATKVAKAKAYELREKAAIAKENGAKNAETLAAQARTAEADAKKAVDAEIAFKKARVTSLTTAEKAAKEALEAAEKKLSTVAVKTSAIKARHELAKDLEKDGKVSRETFETALTNGIESAKSTTSKGESAIAKAFEAIKGKLPKVKSGKQAAIFGAVGLAAGVIVKLIADGGHKQPEEA